MKKFHLPVYSYPLAAMLFWGFSFIWSSVLLQFYQPITIIFVRLVISTLFLFALLQIWKNKEKLKRKDIKLLFFSALFNPFLYFLNENYGLKFSSPTIAAVIIATIPVFSPLVGYLTVKERLSPVNLAGIAISFSGVLLIIITRDLALAADYRGVLFLFGAVASALFYSVALRKLTAHYSALFLVAHQNLIGVFLFLPFFLLFEAGSAIDVPITGQIISSMLLLSILASSAAFVLFAQSVKLLGISKSNIFSNLIPVFTAIFSYFLLSEQFSIQKTAGIFLVITGVYLSERARGQT